MYFLLFVVSLVVNINAVRCPELTCIQSDMLCVEADVKLLMHARVQRQLWYKYLDLCLFCRVCKTSIA